MIEYIEELCAELSAVSLAECESLEYGEIHVEKARAHDLVSPQIADQVRTSPRRTGASRIRGILGSGRSVAKSLTFGGNVLTYRSIKR